MKKFIKEHLIQTWIIASIVFAILIHILFVTDAPCDKLQAQWGAGDILTYASTVALGLLAVWQNQNLEYNIKYHKKCGVHCFVCFICCAV